jgi:hypothetical protein
MPLLLLSQPWVENENVSGSVTPVGTLTKQTELPETGTITPSGTMGPRSIVALLSASVTAGSSIVRSITRNFVANMTAQGGLTRQFATTFSGVVTPAASLVREDFKNLTGMIAPQGTLTLGKVSFQMLFNATITTTGSIRRLISRVFAGVIAGIGSLFIGPIIPAIYLYCPVISTITIPSGDDMTITNEIPVTIPQNESDVPIYVITTPFILQAGQTAIAILKQSPTGAIGEILRSVSVPLSFTPGQQEGFYTTVGGEFKAIPGLCDVQVKVTGPSGQLMYNKILPKFIIIEVPLG